MKKRLTIAIARSAQPSAVPYSIWDTEIAGLHLRVQPTGVKTYYLLFRHLRRKRMVRIGPTTVLSTQQARDQARQLLAKVFQGIDPAAVRDQRMSLDVFLNDHYGPWVTKNRKTGTETLKRLRYCFASLGATPITNIERYTVDRWVSRRKELGRSNATLNRDVTCLKAALTKAVEWGFSQTNPLSGLRPLKSDSTPIVRFLSTQERQRLLEALDERESERRKRRAAFNKWRQDRGLAPLPDLPSPFSDYLKPAVLLSLNTGLRRGELLGLTWEQINLSERLLRVDAKTAKSASVRYIPLNSTAFDVLRSCHGQAGQPTTGHVFTRNGADLKQIKRSWLNLLALAKIRRFRWHDLRHDFGSRLTMANVDLNRVRELMGHADFKTTLRYAHLRTQDMRDAVNALELQQ